MRPGGTLGRGGRPPLDRNQPCSSRCFLSSLRDEAYFYARPGTEVPGYSIIPPGSSLRDHPSGIVPPGLPLRGKNSSTNLKTGVAQLLVPASEELEEAEAAILARIGQDVEVARGVALAQIHKLKLIKRQMFRLTAASRALGRLTPNPLQKLITQDARQLYDGSRSGAQPRKVR